MGSSWRHIGSSITFRGRLMWLDGCVRERELAAHPPDAALHHRVALVNASPSAVATWHSAWTADPEKAHAPRYTDAYASTMTARARARAQTRARGPDVELEGGTGEHKHNRMGEPNRMGTRESTADQLRRMRQRYFLKTAPARSHNATLAASDPNACSF